MSNTQTVVIARMPIVASVITALTDHMKKENIPYIQVRADSVDAMELEGILRAADKDNKTVIFSCVDGATPDVSEMITEHMMGWVSL